MKFYLVLKEVSFVIANNMWFSEEAFFLLFNDSVRFLDTFVIWGLSLSTLYNIYSV